MANVPTSTMNSKLTRQHEIPNLIVAGKKDIEDAAKKISGAANKAYALGDVDLCERLKALSEEISQFAHRKNKSGKQIIFDELAGEAEGKYNARFNRYVKILKEG